MFREPLHQVHGIRLLTDSITLSVERTVTFQYEYAVKRT